MITAKDIELIEKFLSGDLNKYEKDLFDNRMSEDKEFAEEVKLRTNLKTVSQEIIRAEFKSIMSDIRQEHSSKKSKKIYLYSLISVAAAAIILLFFFVLDPLGSIKSVDAYIAEAEPATTHSIISIQENALKSEDSTLQIRSAELKISYIQEEQNFKYFHHYFFNNETLYLFKQANDTIHLFYEINREGKRIYHLCRNGQHYKFQQKKQDKLYELKSVDNSNGLICK